VLLKFGSRQEEGILWDMGEQNKFWENKKIARLSRPEAMENGKEHTKQEQERERNER
jgi:hypothetical protein